MISEFKLPLISPHMVEARIECLHAKLGEALKSGAKLLDLSVDLSNNFSQDCPPISFFRIILRENAVLREIRPAVGDLCPTGALIAVFSTTPDEPLDQPPARGVRFATAGIIRHTGMWTGNVA
jgi:pyruvate/2-oxoglutarate dehydrogenase complex dihydrolipoamide acyltransferase (E2) component